MLKFRRKSVLDFLWKYTLRKYKRHLNGEFGICFMWTRYTSFTADFMFPKHDISVCEKCIYSRVLAREFTYYFVTLKCEKKIIFSTEKTFNEFPLTIGTTFLKINCKFLCKFLPLKSRVPNSACLWSAKNSALMYCHSKSNQNISIIIGSIQLLEFFRHI